MAIAAAVSAQSSNPQPTPAQPAAASAKSADSGADTKAGTNAAANGPSDPKAKHTFDEAAKLFRERKYDFALDGFRKADKQDGGRCLNCEIQAYKAARQAQDFKAAREESALLLEHVTTTVDKAQAHFLAGQACLAEGINDKHDKPFEAADSEFQAAWQLQPSKTECLYADGLALAHLKQDGAARERFQQYLKLVTPKDLDYERAERFAEHPEMARERVAPNFRMTALDGRTISLESLTGKVVLIDFWATWCGPCREALPHVREIARKFEGQPFAVISISLDRDDAKWKDFVANNQMTWIQYRDGYFEGPIAKEFGVTAIPATFTIDADGVLQDQHVGDADIEGKIKKLIARAQEVANRKTVAEVH